MAMTLRAARVNVDMTQAQAAEAIGVTQNTIYRWENGISVPNFKYIPKICKAYKLNSYDDIIFLPTNNA
jgi:DNA-binding XRE family transcriptional regulator